MNAAVLTCSRRSVRQTARLRIAAVLIGMGALASCSSAHRDHITLPGGGMSPCFAKGSRPAVTYGAYDSPTDVLRGDVILFRTQIQGRNADVAWRVVGLPSDHVVLDERTVSVNDRPLDRIASGNDGEWMLFAESSGGVQYCVSYHVDDPPDKIAHFEITVPPDHFLVLGDNRDKSYDSRFIGPVPFRAILARFDEPACTCPSIR